MKKSYRFISFFILMLLHQVLLAQVNIQVTVLPPYQSNVTIYGSRPDLVMINLVNTSNQELSIQLHGSISGDNGIALTSKAHTRSSQPIILPAMGTTQLNGMEISNIFDLNQVDMVGISEQEFINGSGLPEGMYNFCVRAFDYNDLSQPLSPEEPQGCTILSISNNEPPIITSPYENQEISEATSSMGFNISWMTVGAPEGVYYNLKMVEVLGNQNPKDVFESASPVFEMPVQSNFFFYGPQNPRLVPGRQYVLAVQAVDPLKKTNFRNNGQSELVTFIYGGEDIWALADSAQAIADGEAREESVGSKEGEEIEDNEFATNRIRGKLLWGFVSKYESMMGKQDHSSILVSDGGMRSGTTILAGTTALIGLNNIANPNRMLNQDPTSVGIPSGMGGTGGIAGSGVNVGTSQNSGIGASSGPGIGGRGINTIPVQSAQGGGVAVDQGRVSFTENANMGQNDKLASGLQVMNTRGMASISHGYNSGKSEAPKGEAPLPGVYVTIKGLKDYSSNVPLIRGNKPITITTQVLLGTAKSDDSGNFEVVLTDPKYADLSEFNRIVMQVNSEDFESYEYAINRSELDRNVNVEIGDHILSAKTFVFEPSFLLEDHTNYPTLDSELEVTIYRRASEIEEHAYLRYEGDLADKERVQKIIDTKKLIPVSRKTISLKDQGKSSFPKLFYSSSLHVEILPKESFIKKRNEDIAVNKQEAVSGQELVVMPEYLLEMNVPFIRGTVRASAGSGASSGVNGAYVQVTFNEDDLVTPKDTGAEESSTTSNSGSGNSGAGNGPLWISIPLLGGDSINIINPDRFAEHAAAIQGNNSGQGSGFPTGQDLINSPTTQELNEFAKGPGLRPYTSRTYDNGEYTIKHLPLLKKGAKYKVQLVEVPAQYRHMKVDTAGRDMGVDIFSDHNTVDFLIDATVITLKGQLVDNDGRGVYMENVRFRDGASFNTQPDGSFEQEMIVQNQILDIKGKLGYLDTAVNVEIADLNNPPQVLDIGKITLKQKVSKSLFTVIEKNKANTFLSGVEIQLGDTTHKTNAQGQWLYEGPGRKTLVTFIPPAESGYVATQQDIDLDGGGEQKEYIISLEKGVKLFGKVQSGGKAISESDILVDDKEYLTTKTDAEGKYSLYVPKNTRLKIVKAAKSGYYTEEKEQLTQAEEVELNFTLKDGGGKNISTLLGFDIQLDNSQEKDGKTIWNGKFVGMKSNSDVFEGSRPQQLVFKNLEVTFDADGNAKPKGNEVITDAKQLKLKLFDYLPIFMNGDGEKPLKVVANPDGMGSLSGILQIDVNQWVKNEIGVNMGRIRNAQLRKYNTTGSASIEVFNADKNRTTPQVDFVLSKKDTADISIELFGFKMNMDLTKSIISQNGFSTVGYVLTPDIGIVKADSIAIDLLKISRQFGLEEIKFSHTLPDLEIGNWVATLGKVSMDEFGFKLDGEIDLNKKPKDKEAKGGTSGAAMLDDQNKIAFSKLSFTNSGLFGGTFTLPADGISVLGLMQAKKGETPMTFQKKDDVYTIAGSAVFKFEKLIKKEIKVNSFQVQSDGHFFAIAPTDYSLDLGFASYTLEGVEIRNKANEAPSISLRGEFKVGALNAFKMQASNINFVLDRNGNVDYKIDSIAASFKTPVFDAEFALGLLDSTGVKGFNGSGSMGIPSTPINAALNFAYHKFDSDENDKNKFFLSAGFRAGAIIPIGAVTIDSVGGGFAYNSQKKEFKVEIGGNASILNAKHLAQLKDLKLGVTSNSGENSGVIIHGETNVVVGSIVNLAKASVTMNTHAKQFLVNVDGQFSPVDNLAKMQINGDLIVQWHPDDTYVFLGAHANANLAGILKGQADFAIGVNVKSPRTHPMTSKYFTNLDATLAKDVFTGAYVNGLVEKDINFSADVWIAAAKLKLESRANAVFFVNFASQRELLMRMDGRIHLEAGISLLGWNVIGAKAGACYGIGGGYHQSLGGWNFDGYAAVYARVDILRPHSCNDYTILSTSPGATVCFHAHGRLNYRNNTFSIAGGIGQKDTNNCPINNRFDENVHEKYTI